MDRLRTDLVPQPQEVHHQRLPRLPVPQQGRLNSGQITILANTPAQSDFISKRPAFTLAVLCPPSPARPALATCPLSAIVTKPVAGQFCQIASLPSIVAGPTDISAAYLTQFLAPDGGMKITVQSSSITANGFRGSPFAQTFTVAP